MLSKVSESASLVSLKQLTQVIESENYFALAYRNDVTRKAKQNYFSANKITRAFIVDAPNNLVNARIEIKDIEIERLNQEELKSALKSSENSNSRFDNAVIVMTNNNASHLGLDLLDRLNEKLPKSIVAVHDYDNHHWHEMSLNIAANVDVYFPAHLTDNAMTSRLSAKIVAGQPCGSLQWTKEYLLAKTETILNTRRNNEPLGMHHYYEKFKYRNSVLATLHNKYPTVGITQGTFHNKSVDERFTEWVSHKLHIITPVFNDLPIRFFDALITGGIPLVPEGLEPYLRYLRIPRPYYGVYNVYDLIHPEAKINNELERFDRSSTHGVLERYEYALKNFHVDRILENIFKSAASEYRQKIG